MQWFLIILLLLPVMAWLVLRWVIGAEPKRILQVLRWIGLGLAAVLVIVATLAGRLPIVLAIAAFLFPLLSRWRILRNILKTARGPTQGEASEVRTRFVLMRLDHDTGDMDGTVCEGPHSGRDLSALSFEDVLDVYQAARAADTQSAQVLQAYLERMRGEAWQAHTSAGSGGPHDAGPASGGGPMSPAEARAILGVDRNAGPEAIKQAHRRLMKQVHPDHGGSDYLAARINEAKEVLLEE